jgi:hypothetical protein
MLGKPYLGNKIKIKNSEGDSSGRVFVWQGLGLTPSKQQQKKTLFLKKPSSKYFRVRGPRGKVEDIIF